MRRQFFGNLERVKSANFSNQQNFPQKAASLEKEYDVCLPIATLNEIFVQGGKLCSLHPIKYLYIRDNSDPYTQRHMHVGRYTQ